jgi:glucose-1-phosphate adenylyltransferase
MQEVLGIILAGGAGRRLYPLTRERAKPAVPFGGIYRIIDFTLSNCVNSGLRRLYVLTQYKQQSLIRHIRQGWHLARPDLDEFVEILPPQQRVGGEWYRGTADAVYQNLYTFERERFRYALVLSGDHIYKMDYRLMLDFHRAKQADATVAVIEVERDEAHQFGVVEVDEGGLVRGFAEKPSDPRPLPDDPHRSLASMGVYVFNRDTLLRALAEDGENHSSGHDFGRDILPKLIAGHRVYGFNFRDENRGAAKYWRDVGTLDAFYEAHMDLISASPVFDLYDREWPLRTNALQLPPASFASSRDGNRMGAALDSIVSHGCTISGARVRHSVLSYGVRLECYSEVEDSVLLPGVTVGPHARLRGAVIDAGVEIPAGAVIGFDAENDRERLTVTEKGRVVVTGADLKCGQPRGLDPRTRRSHEMLALCNAPVALSSRLPAQEW